MINSLRIKIEMTFRTSSAAMVILENWPELMRRSSCSASISIVDRFILREIKVLPCKGRILTPRMWNNKLRLNLMIPCIFWHPHWDVLSEILGDLVHDVAYARGMPASFFTLSSEYSPMEVKMEMSSNVFKFGNMEPVYSKNIKKILR